MAFRAAPQVPEYVTAAIFSEIPALRYRRDTLIEGFTFAPGLATKDALWAMEFLDRVIQSAASRMTCEALSAGDIILINNHFVLHGRTDFKDPQRLLLRIRVDTVQPVPSEG